MNPIDFRKYLVNDEAPAEAAKNVRALKNSVSNLAKSVEADGPRIQAAFKTVQGVAAELQQALAKLDFNKSDDLKALVALGKQLDTVKAQARELQKDEQARARTQKQLAESTSFYTKELKEQRAALKAAYEAGNLEGFKTAARNIQALSQEANILNKAVRGTASVFTAATGSYQAADQRLQSLRAELRALEGALDASGKGFDQNNPRVRELTAEIERLDTQLKTADKAIGQTYRNVGNYTQSILDAVAALEQEKRVLLQASAAQQAQAKSTSLSAEQQDKLQQEIKETDAALDSVNTQLKGYGVVADDGAKKTEGLGGSFKKYLLALGLSVISFEALGQAAGQVFNNLVEYSDQLADVRKTAGLTADEAERLADGLKAIPTRTSLTGLLDIAKVAGQQGVSGLQNILDFTRAIDVAVTALGDDFSGGAEEIATSLGKIELNFRKSLGPDQTQNLLNIGSAINELGAVGAATAPFLADVANRVAQTSTAYGLGLRDVLAYAAVLEETGTGAEVAGSSLNRLFSTIAGKSEAAFRIAALGDTNLKLKDFQRLINTDFNGAIQAFLKGLNTANGNTLRTNQLLDTLKLESGEAKSSILALAQNTSLFAERQRTANEQLQEGNSLSAEADIKTRTLAGSYEKLKNAFSSFFTEGSFAELIKTQIDDFRGDLEALASGFRKLGEGIDFAKQKLGVTKAAQVDQYAATANSTKELIKNSAEAAKLVKQYEALAGSTNRTAAQQTQMEAIVRKLQGSLGASVGQLDKDTGALTLNGEAAAAALASRQKLADGSQKALQDAVDTTQKLIAQTEQSYQQASQQINKFNLPEQGRQQLLKAAAARKELVDSFGSDPNANSRSLLPEAQIKAATTLITAEQRLVELREKLKNAQAALSDVQKVNIGVTQQQQKAGEDLGDSEEALNANLERSAKALAERTKQRLLGQLAEQELLIARTKEYQQAQGKLFEDNQLNATSYAENVAGTQELITDAERQAASIRVAIATAEADAKLAQARSEYAQLRKQKKISNAELADAQKALAITQETIAAELSTKIVAINDDLAQKLKQQPIEFKISNIDKELERIDNAFDRTANRDIQRMNDTAAREKAKYDLTIEREKEYEEKKREIQAETIRQGVALFAEASNAAFNIRAEQLQREQAILRNNYEKDIEAAGTNEELKARLQEDYTRKELALRRKQAKLDKQQALFNVGLNTAQAVTAVLTTGGGTYYADFGVSAAVISGLVIAQGLAQAAVIASRPLPTFFKGTDNAPEGPALVAERGPELIERKGGGFDYVAQQGIIYLQAGDKVYTADRTSQMLAEAAISADKLHSGPLAAQQSYYTSTAAINGTRTVVVQGHNDKALDKLGDRITRAVERNAAQTASEIMRRRLALGNSSIDEQIHRRMRGAGR